MLTPEVAILLCVPHRSRLFSVPPGQCSQALGKDTSCFREGQTISSESS